MKIIFATLLSAFIMLLVSGVSKGQSKQQVLQEYFDNLKQRNYNPMIPPEGNNGHGSPIRVIITMYILDIHKIDDFNMDYRASFYFRQSWNDSRLAYQDLDMDKITISDDHYIWTPDLFFVQEKDGRKHKITTPNVFIRISPEGEVLYSVRQSVSFSCEMDFRNYPHDTQECQFSIESYGKKVEEMMIDWYRKEPVGKADTINVLPFTLESLSYGSRNVTFSAGTYRTLDVNLVFRRQIGFYITRLYVPFIILVILSWLSFWIKPKLAVLRVPLLLVIMYIMINIGSDIGSFIPPAPYTKASDVWIAVCESLVFAAFLEFIFVSLVSRSEKKFDKKRSSSSSDPEAPIISDTETKENVSNSAKMNPSFKMVACRLSNNKKLSKQVDIVSRVLFPLLFAVFNLVYWIVY